MTVALPVEAHVPAGAPVREAWPRVTVAILAFNRSAEVRRTLGAIEHDLAYPAAALEPIVVDNASTDGTAAMVAEEFPGVRVMRLEENVGVSGWNEALAEGTGEWFLVLDDDCYVEGDALDVAIAAAEANAADLVSFRVRSAFDPDYFFNDEYNAGILSFWGCAALISRRAVERLGGFDPAIFIWGHEAEYTLRLLDAGMRHLFLPDVVAVHMKGPRPAQSFSLRVYSLHYSHAAYTAGKLLRAADAVLVLARMVTTVLVETRAISPEAIRSLPAVLRAFARGLRSRRPVRAEVSRAYRDNFVPFRNPLETLRRPWERRDGADHWQRFFAARRRYFPERASVIGG